MLQVITKSENEYAHIPSIMLYDQMFDVMTISFLQVYYTSNALR